MIEITFLRSNEANPVRFRHNKALDRESARRNVRCRESLDRALKPFSPPSPSFTEIIIHKLVLNRFPLRPGRRDWMEERKFSAAASGLT